MHEIEPKDVAVSVVVYNNQMFLRIIVGKKQVDLPYHGTAEKFAKVIRSLVPYRHGQTVWFNPVRFNGNDKNQKPLIKERGV